MEKSQAPLVAFCEPVSLGEQGSFLRQPSLPGVWKKPHDIFRLFGGIHPLSIGKSTANTRLENSGAADGRPDKPVSLNVGCDKGR